MNDISKLQEELLSIAPSSKEYVEKSKLLAKLQAQSFHINEINRINKDIIYAKSCLSDIVLCELAQEEINHLQIELKKHKYELNKLLSTHVHKNVILEIRAGAGGSEAALFAHDLHNMYMKYSELHKWKYEIANCYYTDLEGIKEIRVFIAGEDAFTLLRHESGVHRVQRIPKTESSGRIHTSTATVAVLPEIEISEIEINPNDIRIDTYRSSGPGGQSVNTTDSAVRIVHIPTNIVVQQQDEKSQYKNKEKAMKILRATLYEYNRKQQHDKESSERKAQVGTGDRSERIRTYNFPQRRVTDHRINKSIYNIDNILNGQELDKFIEELILLDY